MKTRAKTAKADPQKVEPIKSADSFLAMIERLSLDPNVSADKLEKIFDLHQRTQAEVARRAYDVAFHAAQGKLPVIAENGKGPKGSYALLEDIVDAVRPILSEYGFAISHRVESGRDHVKVTCVLAHVGGHREETSLSLAYDLSDGKTAAHGAVSSTSYGRRVTATAMLGIVSRGEDKDGVVAKDAQELECISKDQQRELLSLIVATSTNLDQFLAVTKAESVPKILAKDFASAKAFLSLKPTVMQKEAVE